MKNLISSIILLFVCIILYSQNTAIEVWKDKEFVKDHTSGTKIVADKFKNVWMITSQTDESSRDGYTVKKFDSTGTVLWKVKYEQNVLAFGYQDFAVDSLGNSFVCFGFHYSLGIKGDTRIVKYSTDGQLLWEVNHGAEYPWANRALFSRLDSAGDLYLAGNTFTDYIDSIVYNNLFVSKLDKNTGATIWKKLFPITKIAGGPINIAIVGDVLEVFATGNKQISGERRIIQLSKNDGEVLHDVTKLFDLPGFSSAKICRNGDVLIGIGGAYHFGATRVDINLDTLWNYNKVGWLGHVHSFDEAENEQATYSIGTFWKTATSEAEMITTKYNQSGEVLWEQSFPDNSNIISAGGAYLKVQDSLILCIGGSTNAVDTSRLQIVVYSAATGEQKFALNFKEDKVCSGEQILPTDDGFVYAGWTHLGVPNTVSVLTGRYKFSNLVNTNEPKIKKKVQLFPNPTSTAIQVYFEEAPFLFQNLSYSVTSSSGNLILRQKLAQNNFQIDVSQFKSGSYFLNIYERERLISKEMFEVIH